MSNLLDQIEISDYTQPGVSVKRKLDVVDINNRAMICIIKLFENDNGNYGNEINNGLLRPYQCVISFDETVFVNPLNGITCTEENGVWTDNAQNMVDSPKLKLDWWTDIIKNSELSVEKMQEIVINEDLYNNTFNFIP